MAPGPARASLRLRGLLLGLMTAFAWSSPVGAQGKDLPDLGTALSKIGNLSTYTELVKKYPDLLLQLPRTMGVTIIAPSNEAFSKVQGFDATNDTQVLAMLQYHALQGTITTDSLSQDTPLLASSLLHDKAFTNVTAGQSVVVYRQPGNTVVYASGLGTRSELVMTDVLFSGGTIEMVDTMLVVPPRLEGTLRDGFGAEMSAFLGAAYRAGIEDEIASARDVTIFVPRNDAFQLLAGTLEAMTTEELAAVVRYHVVPGKVLASTKLVNGSELVTSGPEGATLRYSKAGNNAFVDAARLVQPDILVANGVIHMIDNVLNPSAPSVQPNATLGTQPPAFAPTGATSTGKLVPTPFTSALPCTADCPEPTTAVPSAAKTTSLRSTSSQGFAARPTAGAALAAAGWCAVGLAGLGLAGVV